MVDFPSTADPAVLASAAAIARRLRADEDEVVDDVATTLAREIDRLDADPVLVELLDASVHGNVTTIIHVLANDIPVDHLQPTTAAVEYARRLAQRDVPANSLVRAYHMGQSVVLRRCYQLIGELAEPGDDVMAVTRHVSDVLYRYIDWITLYVFDAYEDERRRWLGVEANVFAAAVHRMLTAPDIESETFERETGYRLRRSHIAAVVWCADDSGVDLNILDRTSREVAVALQAIGPPIATAVDRTTLWVWVPVAGRPDALMRAAETRRDAGPDRGIDSARVVDAVAARPGVRVALGLPTQGVQGFRRSHEQAQAAYAVATVPGSSTGPVVGFGDRGVAIASLLARDVAATRAWVQEVLGGLADDDPAMARLRETLAVYLTTRESNVHTAERLNLHPNTVKYRVAKALAETAPGQDRLDLALALTVCEFLGPAVTGRD
ncbi:PucR family transcriptional regulator [Tsukamurella soli]|uniref:PucR family transcriptional regulator n=1 Tax=Tsukamurella soli TaxID=644556 RepID=UPI0031EA1606